MFTADATSLSIKSKYLAAGSANMTVKVTDVESFETTEFSGHDGPILTMCIDPKDNPEFLVSSGCDGKVKVWSVEEKRVVFTWSDCFPKSNYFTNSEMLGGMAFSPDGEKLAVARSDGV